jgi:glycosyltransferase involved in cell wall biosynthesis
MTRVCFVVNPYLPIYGGGAYYIHKFMPYLKEKGIQGFVVTSRVGNLSKQETIDDIKIYRYFSNKSSTIWRIVTLFTFMIFISKKLNQFDIIHFGDGPGDGYLGILICKLFRKKVVVESVLLGADDGGSIQKEKFGNIKIKIINNIDLIFTISKAIYDSYSSVIKNKQIIKYVPYGINLKEFNVISKSIKKTKKLSYGFADNSVILIFIGAIVERKGIDFLLKVLSKLLKHDNIYHLLLIGPTYKTSENYKKELDNLINENNLISNVHFLGEKKNVAEYLNIADIYVSGSHAEGLGIANIEAMASGLPSVVVDLAPFHDLYPTNEFGFLVERDEDKFSETITSLINDTKIYDAMSYNVRQRVENYFNIEKRAELFQFLYTGTNPK